jgi:hypothetical protein
VRGIVGKKYFMLLTFFLLVYIALVVWFVHTIKDAPYEDDFFNENK